MYRGISSTMLRMQRMSNALPHHQALWHLLKSGQLLLVLGSQPWLQPTGEFCLMDELLSGAAMRVQCAGSSGWLARQYMMLTDGSHTATFRT
jgi:hypothetical protein